jgi:hypothetical protein
MPSAAAGLARNVSSGSVHGFEHSDVRLSLSDASAIRTPRSRHVFLEKVPHPLQNMPG